MRARATFCAALTAAGAAAASGWAPVGPVIAHDAILASALDFDDATGGALVAYGFADAAEPGATTIEILSEAGAPGQGPWTPIANHTPQFAQDYDGFAFRARTSSSNGSAASQALYIGLRIDGEGISSVLRSSASGGAGFDGFEGCYAFNGFVWDFEVSPGSGDLQALSSPDNATVGLMTYGAAGYDQYPAGNTWSTPVPVPLPAGPGGATVAEVTLARGGGDALYGAFSWSSSGGGVQVGSTSLAAATGWTPLLLVLPGAGSPALAWSAWSAGGGNGTGPGLLCLATLNGTASPGVFVGVRCTTTVAATGGADAGAAPWVTLPAPPLGGAAGVAPGLPPGLALVPVGGGGKNTSLLLVVAAVDAADTTTLRTASCVLSDASALTQGGGGGAPPCAAWLPDAVSTSPQAVNDFTVKARGWWQATPPADAGGAVYAVVSAGTGDRVAGDTLGVYRFTAAAAGAA